MKPLLLVESHVPCVPDELSQYFNISRLNPEDFTPDAVAQADAMIIRTRTRCDASLLDGSRVRFIATATIGTDHIDIPYCRRRGIAVASAPGCNAPAVAQYVMASILTIFPDDFRRMTLGVVGVGHVGSIVARWARQLGMNVIECDPPRASRGDRPEVPAKFHAELGAAAEPSFAPLDEIAAQADIITFHVPHTRAGECPTHHLVDAAFLGKVDRRGITIINTARGPIVDTPALISAMEQGAVAHAVIDCWENEPAISHRLLHLAAIATPHIAGYSLNGKIRATSMAVNALCEHFRIDYRMTPACPPGAAPIVTPSAILSSYSPLADTRRLRDCPSASGFPAHFETLRNTYPLRPEVPFPVL